MKNLIARFKVAPLFMIKELFILLGSVALIAGIFSFGHPIVFLAIASIVLYKHLFTVKQYGNTWLNDSLDIVDTTYAGTFAPYYVLPALGGMDTVNKGCIYVKDGIKKQHTIGVLNYSNPWQPRVATPTTSGGPIVVTGNQLVPQDQMLYQEINPRDLEEHWEAEKLSPTLLTRELPATFENYVTALVVQRAMEQVENEIWMGSTTYTATPGSAGNGQICFFNGLLKLMLADNTVTQVANPTTLTASNIGAAFFSLYQSMAENNKAMLTNANKYNRIKFLVSVNTDLIYEEFLTTQPFKNNNTTDKGIRQYKGYEVQPLFGLPDNTIVLTEALPATDGNIWFGLNSVLDENFQLARVLPASELFFIKMLMKMCVNYGFGNKIFLYTTLTTATFNQ